MISQKTIKGFLFLLFVLFVVIISCRKDSRGPFWDVDILAPLVKSSLTINDLIPDSLLQENPDNSFDLVYTTGLYSFSVDTLFKIPDTTLSNTYPSFATAVIAPGGGIIPVISNNIKYPLGDVQLTDATIRAGKMILTINSGIKGLVDFNYKIQSFTDIFGNSFDTTVTIPAATATAPGIYSGSFDLSGYKVDLRGPAGNSVNTLMTSYSASVTPTVNGGYTTTINPGDQVQISNTFDDIIMQYAKGYFGHSISAAGPDTTDLSLFSHVIGGGLDLETIDINFNIVNSMGADVRFTLNNLTSLNTRTGVPVSLTHAIIGSAVNLNRAVDNNGNVTASTYSVSFKPSNSNIDYFFENLPTHMSYQLDLEINPLGNVSGSNDFVYYDKLMKTEMNITVPLSLIANDLTIGDTVDFSIGSGGDKVNHGTLSLFAENGFPFTAEVQLYPMNENFLILDSLVISPAIIAAPALDGNFVCTGQKLTRLDIPVDAKKMETLRSAKNMYIKIKFNTAGKPNHVKIYSFYKIDVKLVGDFNYTVGN